MPFPPANTAIIRVTPFNEQVAAKDFFDWYPERRVTAPEMANAAGPGERARWRQKGAEFEIGLVMAGTVSAGAYTAGVLDYLVEALDRWEAHAGTGAIPPVDARLSVAAGTSGGGVCAGLLLQACRYRHTPVRTMPDDAAHEANRNPFYRVWTSIAADKLAERTDQPDWDAASARSDMPPSLLNGRVLEDLAQGILLSWPNQNEMRLRDRPPAWVADRLRLYFSLGNSSGIPYQIRFQGAAGGLQSHQMVMHMDFSGFDLVFDPDRAEPKPPDVYRLDWRQKLSNASTKSTDLKQPEWELLRRSIIGTGAFPVALPPQEIGIDPNAYTWRFAYINSAGQHIWAEPWPERGSGPDGGLAEMGPYSFFCYDGGAYNNEPIEVVSRTMFGTAGPTEEDGKGAIAERAMIFIDPLIGPDTEDQEPGGAATRPQRAVEKFGPVAFAARSIFAYVGGIFSQTRFKQIDLTLAEASDVHSRFMISPKATMLSGGKRVTVRGTAALTTGGVFAFAGFFSRAQRWRDFQLGRRNCRDFLLKTFLLPEDNPVIRRRLAAMDAAAADAFRARAREIAGRDGVFPVIPVVEEGGAGQALAEIDLKGAAAALRAGGGTLRPRLKAYVKALDDHFDLILEKTAGIGGFFGRIWLQPLFSRLDNVLESEISRQLSTVAARLERHEAEQWEADDGGRGF